MATGTSNIIASLFLFKLFRLVNSMIVVTIELAIAQRSWFELAITKRDLDFFQSAVNISIYIRIKYLGCFIKNKYFYII